jgi:hypothetical protein
MMKMKIVTCPNCESALLEYYNFDDGSEKCVCEHCGEWETEPTISGVYDERVGFVSHEEIEKAVESAFKS